MYWRLQKVLEQGQTLRARWRRLLWNRRAARFPRDSSGLVRLHIGCGEIDAPGFVNVDARPYPHVHLVTKNLFDLRGVPDNSASLVYMCHVLEHVSFRNIDRVLREMRRILSDGGTIRVSVPDFDRVLEIYDGSSRAAEAIVRPLMGGQDYPFNYHHCIFNRRSLSEALSRSGFVNVRSWDPTHCEHHDFLDWASRPVTVDGRDFPISLNLEGDKPRLSR